MEKGIYCGDAALRRKVASITAPWSKPNRGTVVLPWLSAVFDGRSLFQVPGGTVKNGSDHRMIMVGAEVERTRRYYLGYRRFPRAITLPGIV